MEIIHLIDKEIERLNTVKALLQDETLVKSRRPKERPKRTVSPEGREAMAAAQRKRWADKKRLQRAKE